MDAKGLKMNSNRVADRKKEEPDAKGSGKAKAGKRGKGTKRR